MDIHKTPAWAYDILVTMTRLLEQAIEQLKSLPDSQQDQLAKFLISELAEDARWSSSTSKHEAKLNALAASVLEDDSRGLCEPLDPDRL